MVDRRDDAIASLTQCLCSAKQTGRPLQLPLCRRDISQPDEIEGDMPRVTLPKFAQQCQTLDKLLHRHCRIALCPRHAPKLKHYLANGSQSIQLLQQRATLCEKRLRPWIGSLQGG